MRVSDMKKLKFKYKTKDQWSDFDKKKYFFTVDGDVLEGVTLEHSREVALEPLSRRKQRGDVVYSEESSHNTLSARVNPETGRTLAKGIQLYRLWFQFLKLALELEEKKVGLVVAKDTLIKDLNKHPDIPSSVIERSKKERYDRRGSKASQDAGTNPDAIFRCKVIHPVKVDRKKYEGWDLDRVLTENFNDWWFGHEGWGYHWDKKGRGRKRVYIPNPDMDDVSRRGHSHLFAGHAPTFLESRNEWVDDDNFLYIRIDKTSQWRDVSSFVSEEVGKRLRKGVDRKFKISGKSPRVNTIQNNFNALVLSLKGWTDKDICTHEKIYLRKTDESINSNRTKGDRLTVKKNTKGYPSYGGTVATQRDMGIWHIFEVCEGRFGISKPTK
jgi:hypothetical protein